MSVIIHEIDLMRPEHEVASLRTLLSPEEKQRADRFVRTEHQHRFIVARAELRRIVGSFLGVPPASVEFQLGSFGKPQVVGCEFNLSHSHERGLIGCHRNRPLGIDIEFQRELRELHDLAARFFAPSEADWIRAGDSQTRFFRLWTLKEAVMKACGRGLQLSPREIVFNCEAEPVLHSIECSRLAAAEWLVEVIPVLRGYHGAVAVQR